MPCRPLTPWFHAWLLCSSSALLCVWAGVARADASAQPVRILIESPVPGEPVRNEVHQAPIRGNALAEGERPAQFDVMIVLDISGSTKVASGVDVDADGEVGINPNLELLPPGAYPAGTSVR